jgi:hypothetical protein
MEGSRKQADGSAERIRMELSRARDAAELTVAPPPPPPPPLPKKIGREACDRLSGAGEHEFLGGEAVDSVYSDGSAFVGWLAWSAWVGDWAKVLSS